MKVKEEYFPFVALGISVVVLIAFVFLIGVSIRNLSDAVIQRELIVQTCYENGYTDYQSSLDKLYCVKQENGTDIIVDVETLLNAK